MIAALLMVPFMVFAGGTTEEGASKGEVTLHVFDAHAYGLDEYAEMAAKFEEENPGVKIEAQHAANDSNTIFKSKLNSGDIPDVFDAEAGTSARSYYEYAYDWSNDKDVLALFNEAALETGKDENGRIMSLPWTSENMGLIYNKDVFAKAGITKIPATMDELEDACKKIDAIGIPTFALAAKETWVLGQLATHFMMDKSLDAQGVVDALNNGTLKFKDMPNFKNLFRFLDLAVKYGVNKPLEVDWETSENKLANGQAAIIHMGDWCQSVLDSFNPNANLAFLPCPVSDNPDDVTLLSSTNWTYIVYKDSPNLELAKKYAVYILSSEMGQYWMCDGVGAVPGCKTDRPVKGTLANDAAKYIKAGKVNGWIHTKTPTGYTDFIGPELQAYMLGNKTSDEVIQDLQNFWDANK